MKRMILAMAMIAIVLTANAQTRGMKMLQDVGCGAEIGLMGAGVEVSMPVISDFLVVAVGVNFPTFHYNTDIPIRTKALNDNITKLNKQVDKLNSQTTTAYQHIEKLDNKTIMVSADARLNLTTVKAMVELYPLAQKSFHVTAGVMVGSRDFVKVKGSAGDQARRIYRAALKLDNDLRNDPVAQEKGVTGVPGLAESLRFNIDDKTYGVSEDIELDATIRINSVRPYLGVGIGKAVPDGRLGYQIEMGAWYHGTPEIVSSSELDTYDPTAEGITGVEDVMCKISFYPQLTFRLTGRIF